MNYNRNTSECNIVCVVCTVRMSAHVSWTGWTVNYNMIITLMNIYRILQIVRGGKVSRFSRINW